MPKITAKQISSRIGLVRAIYSVLDEKLAENIKVIQVEKQTSLCNYFVICEGRASTHVRALADELEDALAKAGRHPLSRDGKTEGNWIVRDYASVIVHIFDRPTREFYGLENLWRDGKVITREELKISD